jgi:hypothetical protein
MIKIKSTLLFIVLQTNDSLLKREDTRVHYCLLLYFYFYKFIIYKATIENTIFMIPQQTTKIFHSFLTRYSCSLLLKNSVKHKL